MGLFDQSQMEAINRAAQKSKQSLANAPKPVRINSLNAELEATSNTVREYFKNSNAIIITDRNELHEYISKIIEYGFAGIDTETTGLDKLHDYIVGASLYAPNVPEAYIPLKHRIPIFEDFYRGQLSYEDTTEEFQRLVDAGTKLIFANADFDLSMIYKDLNIDFCDNFHYDVILAWRCIKENEQKNGLKELYNKYVLKGKGDPKRFSDFFSPALFPYAKPEVAGLYAANDAKITFELYKWQLPYVLKDNPKCQKNHLERIADLLWNLEFPLVKICQMMHRDGMAVDLEIMEIISKRYHEKYHEELAKLRVMVQEVLDNNTKPISGKQWITSGDMFNPDSAPQVKYLCYNLMGVIDSSSGTGKDVLTELNLPITNQILEVRSLSTLLGMFVDKLPSLINPKDGKIHASFKQLGASTGRFSSADPNMQQIPSKAEDIRHIFRATPGYVLLSSDYSAQEPRITAYLGSDAKLIKNFQDNRDVYSTIASEAYDMPYERCLEFHPETHEYQPDGKQRRTEAKKIFLGIAYGRSIKSIGEQIYGTRTDMSEKEKEQGAKRIYDAVVDSFSGLKMLMHSSQAYAKKYGYVETILGRRRHIPDMQLPEFEFKPLPGYVNPLLDPLNPDTFEDTSDIPETTVKALTTEFKKYKRWGQIVRRTEQLYSEKIKVINNRKKITDASRQCLNCVDTETEILTVSGWKHYNEISIGEHIYAFDMETERIVLSHIEDVFEYEGEIPVVEFKSRSMSAVSTLKHRWVVTACNSGNLTIKSTEVLMSSPNVNFPIIRSGLNGMEDDRHWNTNFIKILGWVYGSGNFWDDSCPSIVLNVGRKYNRVLINEIKECLIECGIVFESYTKNWNTVIKLVGDLPEPLRHCLQDSYMPTNAFSQFSASQSMLLMDSMIDGCGYSHSFGRTTCYVCSTETEIDRFQHIAFLAGYSTNVRKSDRVAGAYIVTVLRNERAHITKKHCTEKTIDKVWCVSTPHKTWIARRHGTTYITGNSMVQGSAADQTKMAMIALCKDPDWQRIGGRILIPIHDELLCEVPVEYWKEGGEILSRVMCDAASFLPFDSKCDVTTSIHWMGLEYPCPYSKPDSIEDLNSLSESEIKWVQYHLIENEYPLPVYKDEDGNKPRGDAAKGVNGVNSSELESAVERYCTHFRITRDEFIHHIESRLNTN